jgi:hypothetical protein
MGHEMFRCSKGRCLRRAGDACSGSTITKRSPPARIFGRLLRHVLKNRLPCLPMLASDIEIREQHEYEVNINF